MIHNISPQVVVPWQMIAFKMFPLLIGLTKYSNLYEYGIARSYRNEYYYFWLKTCKWGKLTHWPISNMAAGVQKQFTRILKCTSKMLFGKLKQKKSQIHHSTLWVEQEQLHLMWFEGVKSSLWGNLNWYLAICPSIHLSVWPKFVMRHQGNKAFPSCFPSGSSPPKGLRGEITPKSCILFENFLVSNYWAVRARKGAQACQVFLLFSSSLLLAKMTCWH